MASVDPVDLLDLTIRRCGFGCFQPRHRFKVNLGNCFRREKLRRAAADEARQKEEEHVDNFNFFNSGGGTSKISDSIIPGDICRVSCTRSGYYTIPPLKSLDWKVDPRGNCFVSGFTVGRRNYGSVRFLSSINTVNLDLDTLVFIDHKKVLVYPDECKIPPVGEGLNCPAEVTLLRIWPSRSITNEILGINFESRLKKACKLQGSQFISYDGQTGVWKFKVHNFSKYTSSDGATVSSSCRPRAGFGVGVTSIALPYTEDDIEGFQETTVRQSNVSVAHQF